MVSQTFDQRQRRWGHVQIEDGRHTRESHWRERHTSAAPVSVRRVNPVGCCFRDSMGPLLQRLYNKGSSVCFFLPAKGFPRPTSALQWAPGGLAPCLTHVTLAASSRSPTLTGRALSSWGIAGPGGELRVSAAPSLQGVAFPDVVTPR